MKPKLRHQLEKEVESLNRQARVLQEQVEASQTRADHFWHEASLIKTLLTELPKALPKPGQTTEGRGDGQPVRKEKLPPIDKELAKKLWGLVDPGAHAGRVIADILGYPKLAGPIVMLARRKEWGPHGTQIFEVPLPKVTCNSCHILTVHKPCE